MGRIVGNVCKYYAAVSSECSGLNTKDAKSRSMLVAWRVVCVCVQGKRAYHTIKHKQQAQARAIEEYPGKNLCSHRYIHGEMKSQVLGGKVQHGWKCVVVRMT